MPQAQANVPTELEAALDYARTGIPVFPCNPLDKKPLTPNGFKDATKDEAQIRAWWGRWPNGMVGALTGPASGMWVVDLDIDPAKKIDGKAALDQLVAQRGALPPTLMTITPRGGQHLIFSWDPNHDIRNSAGRIGPGIDVRGDGGYVCLPPSRNASGGEYRWDANSAPQSASAPGWLVALPSGRSKPGPAPRSITSARRSPPLSQARATPRLTPPLSTCSRSSPAASSTRTRSVMPCSRQR